MRTEEELINTMSIRRTAWDNATEMVAPVLHEYDLEEYKVANNFFSPGSTMTQADQNVEHIIHVADWLLEPLT